MRRACHHPGAYLQELSQRFLEVYPHDVPLKWFGMEMKPMFDIDVFASEFPKERGYKIYLGSKANLLLLKLESLYDCAQDAFEEFLGLQEFNLVRANEASGKWYADLYQEFKRKVTFEQSFVNRLYETRYMKHFYTVEEIETFRQKWCGNQ